MPSPNDSRIHRDAQLSDHGGVRLILREDHDHSDEESEHHHRHDNEPQSE